MEAWAFGMNLCHGIALSGCSCPPLCCHIFGTDQIRDCQKSGSNWHWWTGDPSGSIHQRASSGGGKVSSLGSLKCVPGPAMTVVIYQYYYSLLPATLRFLEVPQSRGGRLWRWRCCWYWWCLGLLDGPTYVGRFMFLLTDGPSSIIIITINVPFLRNAI